MREPARFMDVTLLPAVTGESSREALKLDEVKALALGCQAHGRWEDLVELGNQSAETFPPDDRQEGRLVLLRCRVQGLARQSADVIAAFSPGEATLFREALAALERLDPHYYDSPEFELCVLGLSFGLEDCVRGLQMLATTCRKSKCRPAYFTDLRERTVRLMQPEKYFPERTPEDEALLAAVPEVDLLTREVFAEVAQRSDLSEAARTALAVATAELDLLTAQSWEIPKVLARIRRLPSPHAALLASMVRRNAKAGTRQQLTPSGWAFLVALSHATRDDLVDLATRWQANFGSDPCDGLAHLVQAVAVDIAHKDKSLAAAVELLIRFADQGDTWLGSQLTISTSEGPRELSLGRGMLTVPKVTDLVAHLVGMARPGHYRAQEFVCLSLVFSALVEYRQVHPAAAPPGLATSDALRWLCEQSLAFHFSAAATLPNPLDRIHFGMEALVRSMREGVAPAAYYALNLHPVLASRPQALNLLDLVLEVRRYRDDMSEMAETLWLDLVGCVFHAMLVLDGPARGKLLALANHFEPDLTSQNEFFALAFLEHIEGDAHIALHHYLAHLMVAEGDVTPALSNVVLLWEASSSAKDVRMFVHELRKAAAQLSDRQAALQSLLADAERRLDQLEAKEARVADTIPLACC